METITKTELTVTVQGDRVEVLFSRGSLTNGITWTDLEIKSVNGKPWDVWDYQIWGPRPKYITDFVERVTRAVYPQVGMLS